ncbi:MAG: VWA domain-containing protein [Simkaniaceae bacterium]|nr:MAG: VWA domain-containing protein [Simkaniaceae bacterium]
MALGALAWRVISYIRSRPQYPIVSLKSSLNVATLSIETLKSEVVPPNVSLTFCVDTSGSMQGERQDAVKAGVNQVLDSALRVVNAIEGAQIEIAIVGFDNAAKIICEPTKVLASSLDQIKRKLADYKSGGMTKIIAGLDQATTKLEEIAKRDTNRVHTLILLSDGDENLSKEAIQPIHTRLAKVNAQLFAIGIGRGHDQETLQKIAPETGRFRGTYIDTTLEDVTIENAITSIYEQAVAVFSELVLSTTQLAAGAWSVNGDRSGEVERKSVCHLGSFTEERGVVKRIEIHSARLGEKLDLADVVFDLAFKDPRGRAGTMKLHWNPNTVMDPEILN